MGAKWTARVKAWLASQIFKVLSCPCKNRVTATICEWLAKPDPPACYFPDFWAGREIPEEWGKGCKLG